jgi:hypothetical protein
MNHGGYLSGNIEENMLKLLDILGKEPINEVGEGWVNGLKLQEATGLSPTEINYAITILLQQGLVEWQQFTETAPFIFGYVTITPRGRYELQRAKSQVIQKDVEKKMQRLQLPVTPVGSPFGFSDVDWKYVAEMKSQTRELRVVFGYQFKSEYYDTEQLKRNVKDMFQNIVDGYNKMRRVFHVDLVFKNLSAGYGEHLFNEIARDLISADIAVFETSDLNPNVMLEMGVALTWGVRVLPIKREGCPKPPSDISGQTWADYLDNAAKFVDSDHDKKLMNMVERAAKKKGISL